MQYKMKTNGLSSMIIDTRDNWEEVVAVEERVEHLAAPVSREVRVEEKMDKKK